MKLGIGTYTFAWSIGMPGYLPETPLSPFDLLDLAEQLQVKLVQFGPNLSLDQLPEPDLARFLQCARDRKIDIEVGTKGIDPELLARQIDLAHRAGSDILRWSVDDSGTSETGIDEIAACIHQVLPDLRRNRIRLAIENSRIPSRQLAAMLQKLKSVWLGVTLDTVNSLAVPEGPDSVLENLIPYVANVHIKDFQVSRMRHRMGFVVEGRPAGAGQLNIPHLLETLRSTRVSANVILELWPPEQDTILETIALEHRWAAESIAYLRRHILN